MTPYFTALPERSAGPGFCPEKSFTRPGKVPLPMTSTPTCDPGRTKAECLRNTENLLIGIPVDDHQPAGLNAIFLRLNKFMIPKNTRMNYKLFGKHRNLKNCHLWSNAKDADTKNIKCCRVRS
jgi:hypothetical protein